MDFPSATSTLSSGTPRNNGRNVLLRAIAEDCGFRVSRGAKSAKGTRRLSQLNPSSGAWEPFMAGGAQSGALHIRAYAQHFIEPDKGI